MEKFEMPSVRYSDSNEDIADAFGYVISHYLKDDLYDTDTCKAIVTEMEDKNGRYKHVEASVRSKVDGCVWWRGIQFNTDYYFDDDFGDDEELAGLLKRARDDAISERKDLEEEVREREEGE